MNTLLKIFAVVSGVYAIDRLLRAYEEKVAADVAKLRAESRNLPDPWDQEQDRERQVKMAENLDAIATEVRDAARALKGIRDSMGHEVTLDPESITKLRDALLDAVTAPPAPAPAPVVTRTDAEVQAVLTQATQVAEAVAQAIDPAPAPVMVPEVIKVES